MTRFTFPPYKRADAGKPLQTGKLPAGPFEFAFTTPTDLKADGAGFFELVQSMGNGDADMTVSGFGVTHSGDQSVSIQLRPGSMKPSTEYVIQCSIAGPTLGLNGRLTLPTPKPARP